MSHEQHYRAALVYSVTNRVNGKRYIGVTQQALMSRWSGHKCDAARGAARPLQRAIRKYGADAFDVQALANYPSIEWAKAAEVYFITQLAPEYNATKGGDGVWGLRHSDESKAKMTASKKGKKHGRRPAQWIIDRFVASRPPTTFAGRTHTEEAKRKIGDGGRGRPAPNKGVPASPEAIAKRLATTAARNSWPRGMLGKHHSPETREKIRQNRTPVRPWLGKKMTDAQRRAVQLGHSRPIRCLTDGREFECSADAAAYYGIHQTSVSSACSGRYRSVRGLVFEWGVKK